MKRSIGFLLVLLSIIACESEEEKIYSGIETIYSDVIFPPNESQGFSVDEALVLSYPNADQIIPDFKLKVYDDGEGSIALFQTLVYKPTFVFIDSASTSESAKILFGNFSDTNYEFERTETIPYLSKNQIWLVKGFNNTLYKILILDMSLYVNQDYESGYMQLKRYGNVTFQWEILLIN